MKAYISYDERYPDFDMGEDPSYRVSMVEIEPEQFAEWLRVKEAYFEWQSKLSAMSQSGTLVNTGRDWWKHPSQPHSV